MHKVTRIKLNVTGCGSGSAELSRNVSTPGRRGSCTAGDRLTVLSNVSPEYEGLAMRVLATDDNGYAGAAIVAILYGAGCEVGGE